MTRSAVPPGPPPPVYTSVIIHPEQNTTVMDSTDNRRRQQYIRQMRSTAIQQLIGGGVVATIGVAAMFLRAFWSFFATPVWSGLAISGLTGSIGLLASSRKKRAATGGYVTMSVIAASLYGSVFIMYIIAACSEDIFICHPGSYWEYPFYGYNNCPNYEGRLAVDSLITIASFYLVIVSLVSASVGCCFACSCCRQSCNNCCRACCSEECTCCLSPPEPATAVFVNNGAAITTTSHGLATSMQPQFQSSGQPTMVYVVQQAPGVQTVPPYPQAVPVPVQQMAGPQPFIATVPGQQVDAPVYQVAQPQQNLTQPPSLQTTNPAVWGPK